LLLHEAQSDRRKRKQRDRDGDCRVARAHAQQQHLAERSLPASRRARPWPRARRFPQDHNAEQRREQDCDQPGYDKRNRNYRKQRKAVFPGVAAGEADGDEAGDRDQRAGQHRERGGGIGVSRNGEPIEAALEPAHHRVVDQQAESDDESTERDPLKRYAAEGHAEKDDGQDERDRQCDDRAGPQSEGQKADGEHDCDGFPERLREAADRGSGDDRLIGDEVRLDPDRQIGL
jgi:hypothetical protein